MSRMPLSHSRAQTWENCPWQFREVYVRGRKSLVEPVAFAFGRLEHEAIKAYVAHLIRTKQPQAPQDLEAVWLDFIRKREAPVPEALYAPALMMLRKFAGRFVLDLERVWDPEVGLAIDWDGNPVEWFDEAVWLRGRLDLGYADGTWCEIVDFKSNWIPMSQEEVETSLQAQTYALLMWRWNPKLTTFNVKFDFVRYGFMRTTLLTAQDCQRTWDRWQTVSDALEDALAHLDDEKQWAPTPGGHCGTCPVIARCPLIQKGLNDAVVANEERARAVAEQILAVDALAKALKGQLKPYVVTHAPLAVGGYVFGMHKSDSWLYDVYRTMGLAQEHFVDPAELVVVNPGKVKKFKKKNLALFEALEAIKQDAGKVSFGYRRPDDDEAEE